jgi:uncharacterized protein (DUF2336 family)
MTAMIVEAAPSDTPLSGSRLPALIALASDPSSESRRALLRELTDHFFGSITRTQNEEDLYGSVLSDLASDMEAAVRRELSARFAVHPDAPRTLIRRLAHDEVDVAAEVLRESTVLTDEDLLDVVRAKGQDHLRAVSARVGLSEAISDVIVQRGDDETLGHLLRNEGARLSRTASEAAVDRAKSNPALHAATVERSSLPADLLNEMYFVVEARLRQHILEQNASMDPILLESALAAGRARIAANDGALPADYEASLDYVEELRAAGQLSPQMLARFLRSGSRTPFLISLAQLADIDFHTAQQIVERREVDALAVVCKAANLDRALFLTFTVVILHEDGDAMGKAHSYGRLYEELTRDQALRTVRFWRMRRSVQAA